MVPSVRFVCLYRVQPGSPIAAPRFKTQSPERSDPPHDFRGALRTPPQQSPAQRPPGKDRKGAKYDADPELTRQHSEYSKTSI